MQKVYLKLRNQQIRRNSFNNSHERECKKEYVCVLSHFSHVLLFVSLWTAAYQAPLCGIL